MASLLGMSTLLRLPPILRSRAFAAAAATTPAHIPQHVHAPSPYRSPGVLDEWVQRDARPVSLRRLTFFGRTLTEERLITSANYVRLELPTRIAHRLRNMQTLPYAAMTNQHINHVYELYYSAFERFRKVPEVRTLQDNDKFCDVLRLTLREHLSVIPRLAMGILEIQESVSSDECDRFMIACLRSRISRRVICEQHLALSETFNEPWHFQNAKNVGGAEDEHVGEIFLKCSAKETIERCASAARELCAHAYGPSVAIPEISLQGHLDTTFPYIPSHLEYIIGELLRNSIQAVVEQRGSSNPPPIEVLICEAAQQVIIRVSDRGGGVDRAILPFLWSFAKGPRRDNRLQNLGQVPRLQATMQELLPKEAPRNGGSPGHQRSSSLTSLTGRRPDLKLGMGLPMSKIYAEYWGGSLEIHSLEGYGCDAFLQIGKLGNKNEVLSTRAQMDAV